MNKYEEYKDNRQKEINEFPIGFAFSDEQFEKMKEKLNVKSNKELISIGYNGFIRKSDKEEYIKLLKKGDEDFNRLISEDTNGEGFIADMFKYELPNHEFGYTWNLEDTLDALNLTKENVINDKKYFNGINIALREIYNAELLPEGYVTEL